MNDIIRILLLVCYETYNLFLLYSIIPFINMDLKGMSMPLFNFVLFALFISGQLSSYFGWYKMTKYLSISSLINVKLLMCICSYLLMSFTQNIYMLMVSRYLLGASCTFVSITHRYIYDNYKSTRKKLYLFAMEWSLELGKILGTFVGGYFYVNRVLNIGEEYPLFTLSMMSIFIGIGLIMINMMFSICHGRIICEGDSRIINIKERMGNEPIDPNHIEYLNIGFIEFIKEAKHIYLILLLSTTSAIISVFVDLLKIFLSDKSKSFNTNYDQNFIQYFMMIGTIASLILSTIIMYLLGDINLFKYGIILLGLLIQTYPFYFMIEGELARDIVSISVFSVILILYNMIFNGIFKFVKHLLNPGKIGIVIALYLNIKLLIEIILAISFTMIYITTENEENRVKYIIDSNSIFYIFGIFLIIPCIFYYRLYKIDN